MNAKPNRPMIIGHRGAMGMAPENTIASFRLALEQGSDGLELDIHMTKDGRLAVIHDHTLDRTTTGTGAVASLTAAELKQADAGVKFDPRFAGERVPLLEEVFEIVPANIMINVEIKSRETALLEALAAMLTELKRKDNVVVSSFDHKILKRLKEIDPAIRIGLLYSANPVDHPALAASTGTEVYSLHPHHYLLDEEDVTRADQAGLQVYTWTVNEEEDLRRWVNAGAHGIITNYPARLKALLNNR